MDRARNQPEVVVDRVVMIHGPQLTALLQSGRPMLVSELEAHPDQHPEMRRFRYGHILGPGLPDDTIAAWQNRHLRTVLSADTFKLLRQINGIHLWADLDNGRSYFGVLPLAEWRDAHEHEAAPVFEKLPRGTIVISYHDNGDYFLLLNSANNHFTWFDPQAPDDSESAGESIEDLLGWWWERAQELDRARIYCAAKCSAVRS
jgi:hypothetical protein